jgi:hypothetical protein
MKYFLLFCFCFFNFSTAFSSEPKSASKTKSDLAAKAAQEQRVKEERDDEFEEKNRWIWRYTLKNSESYWLHTSNRPTACKGNLQAVKTRWQLNQHETIQELCWSKKPGDTHITIIDPQAYLMSTTKIDAAKFDYIPSNKEKKAAALAEQNRQLRDAILEDYSRSRREEKDRFERMQHQLLRPPMICHGMGDMLLCD